jgi:hypothetical protein
MISSTYSLVMELTLRPRNQSEHHLSLHGLYASPFFRACSTLKSQQHDAQSQYYTYHDDDMGLIIIIMIKGC